MSATLAYPGTGTVLEMVQRIQRDRTQKADHLKMQDERLTQVLICDTPGLRKGKHRGEPAGFSAFIPETEDPKHLDKDFVPPTSLYELVK